MPASIPLRFTSFVGRERELAALEQLVGDHRVVTLVGAGGCGKTRLAEELVHSSGAERGVVHVVQLGAVQEDGGVALALAAALGVQATAVVPPLDAIVSTLADSDALLVLDNCEHVVAAAACAVAALVAAPNTRVVATSREPLGVEGEATLRVDPLTSVDALRLFDDRARSARDGFVLDARALPHVRSICERLDGIPLAIELAAARVRTVSVDEIARSLDDGFSLLSGGPRTAMPHQRTLEASIEWSFGMLEARELRLLCQLAVFAGAFTLDAATAVAGVERHDVVRGIADLVDRSLVVFDDVTGSGRYRLLETIRAVARRRLAEDPEDARAVRDRHLRHFVERFAAAELTFAADVQGALRELVPDVADAEAAVDWAARTGQGDLAQRLTGSNPRFWWLMGPLRASQLAERSLQVPGGTAEVRIDALVTATLASLGTLDLPTATAHGEEATRLARELDDDRRLGRALCWFGAAARSIDRARDLLSESVGCARRTNDDVFLADALQGLGMIEAQVGDMAIAIRLLRESVQTATRTGNEFTPPYALAWLAHAHARHGHLVDAREAASEALTLARAIGDRFYEAVAAGARVLAAIEAADVGEATRWLHEYDAAAELTPGPVLRVLHDPLAAHIEFLQGDVDGAAASIDRSLDLVALVLPQTAVWALGLRVEIELRRGHDEVASALAERATELAARSGSWAWTRGALTAAAVARARLEWQLAEQLAFDALAESTRCGDDAGRIAALDAIAAAMRARGNDRLAERLTSEAAAARSSRSFDRLDEAVALAQRGRGARGRPSLGWDALTPSELDVIRLAALGLTNPEIATRLYVAPSTVKTHLSSAYRKLGITNRTELAAEAARRSI